MTATQDHRHGAQHDSKQDHRHGAQHDSKQDRAHEHLKY
jgi:hypothetical protein